MTFTFSSAKKALPGGLQVGTSLAERASAPAQVFARLPARTRPVRFAIVPPRISP
jgi:hypothetical protein